jgi:hypothetical protein
LVVFLAPRIHADFNMNMEKKNMEKKNMEYKFT